MIEIFPIISHKIVNIQKSNSQTYKYQTIKFLMNSSPQTMQIPKREQKPHPKSKFTSEEDTKLKQLVNQFGINNWNQISSNMAHRNPRQCKERWFNYLSPLIRKSPWSTDEDELLERKVKEIGPKWVKIAKFFPMRTDIQLKNRWLVLSRKKTREALQKNSQLQKSIKENPHKTTPVQLPSIHQLPTETFFPSPQTFLPMLDTLSFNPMYLQNITKGIKEQK